MKTGEPDQQGLALAVAEKDGGLAGQAPSIDRLSAV
jgi:hypothetical protein